MPDREARRYDEDTPCYVISIAADLVDVHEQTLRHYERLGLVIPSRSQGRIRLYSQRDIEHVRQIKRLMDELGVNLAGVEVIMRMRNRMAQMEQEMEQLRLEMEQEIERLRRALTEDSDDDDEENT